MFGDERDGERGLIIVAPRQVMTPLSFLEKHMNIGNRTGATGPEYAPSGEHRKPETTPNSLPDWLQKDYKRIVFSCMATS